MSITITTWNVNSLKVRQPQVLDFLKETENSILCLPVSYTHLGKPILIMVSLAWTAPMESTEKRIIKIFLMIRIFINIDKVPLKQILRNRLPEKFSE